MGHSGSFSKLMGQRRRRANMTPEEKEEQRIKEHEKYLKRKAQGKKPIRIPC